MGELGVHSLPVEPSAKATFFSFGEWFALQLICSLVAQLGLIAFLGYTALFTPSRSDAVDILSTIVGFAIVGFMIVVTVGLLRAVHDRVAVDHVGLWYSPANSAPTLIEWRSLGSIRQRRFPTQSIEVADDSGTVRIRLQNRLQEFNVLERAINAHLSGANTPSGAR